MWEMAPWPRWSGAIPPAAQSRSRMAAQHVSLNQIKASDERSKQTRGLILTRESTMADVYRTDTALSLRGSEKSRDWTIIISIAVVAVGIVVALCLLTGSSAGYTPDDLGLMNAYP
jgi:hypothetical protein